MNDTQKILTKALGYIRKGWTQGAYARTAKGNVCLIRSRYAFRFCASGAIERSTRQEGLLRANHALAQTIEHFSVPGWNDSPGRKKSEVIAAFKKAIKAAE